VAEVMTTEVVAVKPNTSIDEAMAVITERRCRHLPVIDGERLEGMVSIGDLTRWVTRQQRYEIQDLVNYITGKYPA
jgi:CBS domain-containing protein